MDCAQKGWAVFVSRREMYASGLHPELVGITKKFKCPCHGSGYYQNGENFEGPAPRPLDRYKISLSDNGQLVIDKSVIYRGVAGSNSDEVYPLSLLRV